MAVPLLHTAGQAANAEERKAALSAANKFIKEKNYPQNTQVMICCYWIPEHSYLYFYFYVIDACFGFHSQIQVIPAGAETTLFKQFFFNWLDKDETTGPSQPISGRIARVKQVPFDSSTLHSNTAMAAQHGMVDDGSGKVQVCLENHTLTLRY